MKVGSEGRARLQATLSLGAARVNGLGVTADGLHAYLPGGWGQAAVCHLSHGGSLAWDRRPDPRKAIADRIVLGSGGAGSPFWLSFLSITDSTGFQAFELAPPGGLAVRPLTQAAGRVNGVVGVGAWRVPGGIAVLDNGGRTHLVDSGAHQSRWLRENGDVGPVDAFAASSTEPLGIAAGGASVRLLSRLGSSKLVVLDTWCPPGPFDPDSADACAGRAVVVTADGTAFLFGSVDGGKLSFRASIPHLVDPASLAYCLTKGSARVRTHLHEAR